MVEQGFPGQHTTTTVTSNTTVATNIRFDSSYVKSLPGMLKVGEILLNFVGFFCIMVSPHLYHPRASFFNTVSMTGFWVTGILFLFYLFHVVEKFYKIPWLKVELVFCGLMVPFYLIAASLAVAFPSEAFQAAGFFGYCGMLCYGVDAYLKYRCIQSGEIAQGQRIVSKQTSTVTSPVY